MDYPIKPKNILISLLIGLGWSMVIIILAGILFSISKPESNELIIYSVALGIPVCLVLILSVKKHILVKHQLSWIFLGFQRMANMKPGKFLIQLLISWSLIIATQVIMLIASSSGTPSMSTKPVTSSLSQINALEFGLIFLVLAILVPLTEEIIFRGLIYKYLFHRFGFGIAAFTSAAIFALVHFFAPILWPALFVTGLLTAYLFKKYQSILAPLSLHILTNSIYVLAIAFVP